MTSSITILKNNLPAFSQEDLKLMGQLVGCPIDYPTAVKICYLQKQTGLSVLRGEINVARFGDKPTIIVTRKGYLAYARRHDDYLGMNSSIIHDDVELNDTVAVCEVYRKDRMPVKVKIGLREWRKPYGVWKEKPCYMLQKTAESLALREAYPFEEEVESVTIDVMDEGGEF